ncbi:MAG: hypothetical protein IJ583_10455, partial [Firmicutes bacterium]|nr:hypothetical protein [Bacillota bacterium]
SHSDNTESKYYMDILYYLGRLYIDDSDNERIYELYNTSVITRSDISANEFIENCYNAKDNMHELLYDDETNIHIGKSMDISIEKSVEVDMNELSLNEFDELEESEEDEENENGSDYYSNLLDDLKSAFDFDDDSFDPENDDFDDEDDED